jgi:hypothetical protein
MRRLPTTAFPTPPPDRPDRDARWRIPAALISQDGSAKTHQFPLSHHQTKMSDGRPKSPALPIRFPGSQIGVGAVVGVRAVAGR